MSAVDPDGTYLALDTSGPRGSVAVGAPGDVRAAEVLGDRRAHASRLLPAVEAALARARVDRRELSGVVVGRGPGSFTGVRVGAGTAKGLVRALGIPLHGFSSLEAAAVDAAGEAPGGALPDDPASAPAVCAVFDARGDRVYAACYRVGTGGTATLLEPTAARIDGLLDRIVRGVPPDEVIFAGDGARRHRERIEARGGTVLDAPAGTPAAGALLALLARAPEGSEIVDPGAWEPDYLRESRVRVSAARGPGPDGEGP